MRIGIVNDLPLATRVLDQAVRAGGHEVAWTAADGAEAVRRCARDRPDLVLMDLIMPVMDGVEATRRIMRATPCPILVVTATVTGNASRVYEALGAGALDAIDTPTIDRDGSLRGDALLRRIDLVRRLGAEAEPAAPPMPTSPERPRDERRPVIALAASTGGPQAIAVVLRDMGRTLHAPVLVVQHIGGAFVKGLVEWLAVETAHDIRLAEDGQRLSPGRVLFAPPGRHLAVDRSGIVRCPVEPADAIHQPSADILFDSLCASPCRGVAVVLTGMGRDGAAGLLALRQRGWWTVAQDETSSVVWGMPGAAVRLGAASVVLPLDSIGRAVSERVHQETGGIP